MSSNTYKTKSGAYPHVKINVLDELPVERFVLVLKRLRSAIAKGRPLRACDDTTPGNKSTSCSWGMCHDSAETWPDAQDHIFPADFEDRGRVAPLRAPGRCPMDTRQEGGPSGCFYTCRIFQAKRGKGPSQELALALFDAEIARQTNAPT